MKIKALFLAFAAFSYANTLPAQDEAHPSTFTLVLNQDAAFGFYPAVFGTVEVAPGSSATFYGIFWTNASFGSPSTVTDLWTEVGAGWSWSVLENRLILNPTLGITNGKLLSGGTQGIVGDGIVPGLTAFYLDDRFEVELFGAYYKSLRKAGPITSDYLLYWIYPGIRFSKVFSAGFQAEAFQLTRSVGADPATLYTWVGGYLKATVMGKYALRFSAGKNISEDSDYSSEYYKLNLVIPL